VEKTQKETEIRIIIFYFNNLISLFEEKTTRFLIIYKSKLLNKGRGKKEIENNFKTWSNIFKYHIILFFFTKH